MFNVVVIGVRDVESGRDAIALAREMTSPDRALTLVHVDLITAKPAPDSGSAADAARRRHALEWLADLAGEFAPDADVACVEAHSVRRGLHDFAFDRRADLLVVSASRRDELGRDFIGDDAREVLTDPPCAVALAPAGYAERIAGITKVGVADDGSVGSKEALALGRRLALECQAELSTFAADKSAAHLLEELAAYERSVDVLVLGPHRSRPIDHLLGGSTAQQLADAPSSALLVARALDG
jgi:nucleotide-binding universal stress UspA family protein